MAQFIAINKEVEVNSETIMAFVEARATGREERLEILRRFNIDLGTKEWFYQQDWLDAFKNISDNLGSMNLYMMGKAIVDNAKFPPMNNLKEALNSINVAYHMNHRFDGNVMFDPTTGKMMHGIGDYTLVEFDEAKRKGVFLCSNPYPSDFDAGIISQVIRRFKSMGSLEKVELDKTKETRKEGGETCTYLLSW